MSKKTAFLEPWLAKAVTQTLDKKNGLTGRLIFNRKDHVDLPSASQQWLLPWQLEKLKSQTQACCFFDGTDGPVWLLSPYLKSQKQTQLIPDQWLELSAFAKMRDTAGLGLQLAQKYGLQNIEVLSLENDEDVHAMLVGFELAQYRFRPVKEIKPTSLRILLNNVAMSSEQVGTASLKGWCTNVARHLINLPPNDLYPMSFASIANDLCNEIPNVEVEIWDSLRLSKERMNLILAVGAGSANAPCLLHLRYRPPGKTSAKPLALVGKGITFDSGGLDIKTGSGMRLMKKDMGGGAAVLGAFLWAAKAKLKQPLDAYVALAENSVGSKAFRPSDVYVSRNGQSVEIHNTDAEGRLVLADAIDVALTQKGSHQPAMLVDVATLTGAIKVALGAAVAGLFSNHQPLAEELRKEFWKGGDPVWIMPLVQKYRSQMTSNFADMTNATEGFGGAITAALFLENFVGNTPWAHLDIYAWRDAADGAWSEPGGSGQGVLGLIQWLESQVKNKNS
jgi:leucyl aminopeptidase